MEVIGPNIPQKVWIVFGGLLTNFHFWHSLCINYENKFFKLIYSLQSVTNMKTINKSLIIMFLLFFSSKYSVFSQENYKLSPMYSHIFDSDSLKGFDEEAVQIKVIAKYIKDNNAGLQFYRTTDTDKLNFEEVKNE